MLNSMSPYILLGFLIAGIIHVFVPRAAMSRHLSGHGWKPALKAALLGVPLPLCSCGVLPTAISMRRNGASRGASASFLIATPQTGVDSIAATWSLLGPAFAIVRPVAALVTAVAGGTVVSRFDKEEEVTAQSCSREMKAVEPDGDIPDGFGARVVSALRYGFVNLVGSIGGWLVVGLLIAAVITVYVPDDFFHRARTYAHTVNARGADSGRADVCMRHRFNPDCARFGAQRFVARYCICAPYGGSGRQFRVVHSCFA